MLGAFAMACSGSGTSPSWELRLAPEIDAQSVRALEATIRRGGCQGELIYAEQFTFDGANTPPRPPRLNKGRYGLGGAARDAACQTIAQGCVEVTLPASSSALQVVLQPQSASAVCDAAACSDGQCTGQITNTWWDPGASHRYRLSFGMAPAQEALVDFPVLVRLSPERFDYASSVAAGADLRFVDGQGVTLLAHEVAQWNPGGVSSVWVRIPRIEIGQNGASFWLYSGSGNPPAAPAASEVWSAAYQGVYHFDQDLFDSSAQGFHASDRSTSSAAGQVGGARALSGNTSFIDLGRNRPFFRAVQATTLSVWIRAGGARSANAVLLGIAANRPPPNTQSRAQLILQPNGAVEGGSRSLDSEEPIRTLLSPAGSVRDETWHHLSLRTRYLGGAMALFVDGVPKANATLSFASTVTSATLAPTAALGADDDGSQHFFRGLVDELRLSRIDRSDEWIAWEHLAASDRLLVYGAAETRP